MNFVNSAPNAPPSLTSAIKTVARDRWWWRKLLIGGALWLTVVAAPIVEGFQLESIDNTAKGFPVPLPLWRDFGGKAVQGLWAVVIDFFFFVLPLLTGSMLLLCVVFGLTLGGSEAAVVQRASLIGAALLGLWLSIVWISSISPVAKRRYVIDGNLSDVLTFGLLGRIWSGEARPVYLKARMHSLPAYLPTLGLLAIAFFVPLPFMIRLLLLWLGLVALLAARLLVVHLYDAAAREIERRAHGAFAERMR